LGVNVVIILLLLLLRLIIIIIVIVSTTGDTPLSPPAAGQHQPADSRSGKMRWERCGEDGKGLGSFLRGCGVGTRDRRKEGKGDDQSERSKGPGEQRSTTEEKPGS
jgi:hypothetical protein